MGRALTVGSLFSGIGGFDLGFERAGFEIKWQVEIDEYASAVLAKHWPNVRRYRDVRTVTDLESVDVICGGFPCQPHSLAGKRAGASDERDLWPHFARLIRECHPRWVVAENVPGLLSSDAGRFFGSVLRDLAACGYDAEWTCLPTSAFGAPHRRDRVWIVAYSSESRLEKRGVLSGGDCEPRSAFQGQDTILARGASVADALHDGRGERAVSEGQGRQAVSDAARRGAAGDDVEFADAAGCGNAQERDAGARIFREGQRDYRTTASAGWWESEPAMGELVNGVSGGLVRFTGRVSHGVPQRVHKLKGLGNSIVPQIAEWIARRILEAEHCDKSQL